MKKSQLLIVATFLLIAVLVAGCTDHTRIASILNNPNDYIGKEVVIAGTVTRTYGVNLIIAEAGAYQVDDGSGKIWVFTKSSVPSEGTKIGLKGMVSDKIELLGQTLTAVIQEKERRTMN